MKTIFIYVAGLVFGTGLCVSGMNRPDKVQGFLDIAGLWDPSLAFVMIGAIGVAFFAFRTAASRSRAWLDEPMRLPTKNTIDGRLLTGSAIFGVGWGLAGVCPGPAIVDIGFLDLRAVAFVGAMLAGMIAEGFLSHGRR
jgi:uncharacterized membrane protein YedE/YeeE